MLVWKREKEGVCACICSLPSTSYNVLLYYCFWLKESLATDKRPVRLSVNTKSSEKKVPRYAADLPLHHPHLCPPFLFSELSKPYDKLDPRTQPIGYLGGPPETVLVSDYARNNIQLLPVPKVQSGVYVDAG